MKSKVITLFIVGSLTVAHASIINWSGGGDGVNWSDPLNWSGGAVPTTVDDAVLGPGSTVLIANGGYSLLSLRSQRPISLNGSLTLFSGSSEVKGPLTLTPGSTLLVNGSGVSFLCTNTVSADGAGFYAQNGALIRLPGLKNYSKPDGCYDVYWQSLGTGSVLDLSSLTNISAGNCGTLAMQATGGGQINVSNLVTLTNGSVQTYADGTGSVIDLSNLASFSTLDHWFDLYALNGGQVRMPLMVDGSRLGLTLRNGGVADTAQFARIGGVTVDNQALTLPAVTNVDFGVSLYVYNGGSLSLPLIKSFNKLDGYCDVYWYAYGAGSVLDLSSLTNVSYGGNCGYIRSQAVNGGQIVLSNLVAVATNTYLQAYADGAASVIDLTQLAVFPNASGYLDLQARNNGQVIIPLLVDGSRASITLQNGGVMNITQLKRIGGVSVDNQAVTLPAVTNLDGAINLYVYNGGSLSLPLIKNYTKLDGACDIYWYASGAGSLLDLSSLTNVTYGGNCGYIRAQGVNGGQIVLSNLLAVATNTYLQAYTDGAGSVIDLRKLAVFPDANGFLDLQARNSGQVIIPLLVDGSRAGISLANGGVMDIAQLTRIGGVTVDNQSVTLPAVTNLDGAINLYVYTGGYLSLPLIKNYTKLDGVCDVYWYANGAGSVLDMSALTNISYAGNCGYIRAQGVNGGQIVLSNLVAVTTNTFLQAYADGAGSLIDLSKFAIFPNASGYLDLQARNSGQVLIPLLVDGSRAGLTLVNGGGISSTQLTRIGYVYAENMSVTLPAVTNIDNGVALYAESGAHLSLPQVVSVSKTNGCYDTYWTSYGAGSVLDLSALTNIVYTGDCGYLRMQAYYGAQIIVSNLVSIPDGYVQAYSIYTDNTGTNSLIDLRKLSSFSTPDRWFDLSAIGGGQVMVPLLADGHRVGLSISSGGLVDTAQFTRLGGLSVANNTNDFPAVTNMDGSSVSITQGGRVTLLALTALTKTPGCYNETWQVDTVGQLIAPALSTIGGGDCASFNFNAYTGGQIIFSNLTSLAGPNISVLADGSGSLVDLTKLNSFIAPNGQSSYLTAQNSGVILLGSTAFLLANISVNIPPGNPLLPPVFIAGPNLSLYGTPWHSYLVEARSTLLPDAPWQVYGLVPQTNAFQVVGGPPPASTAFRVTDFIADPAVLEFSSLPPQQARLLLYGLTNKTFQIETTTNLSDALSWTPASSVTMTNAFRFLAPVPASDPQRYFRAKQL